MFAGEEPKGDGDFASADVYTTSQTTSAESVLRLMPDARSDRQVMEVWEWLKHQPVAITKFFDMEAPPGTREALCRHLTLINSDDGTVIFRQGQVGEKVYIIMSGACDIFHTPNPDTKRLLEVAARRGTDDVDSQTSGNAKVDEDAPGSLPRVESDLIAPRLMELGGSGALLSPQARAASEIIGDRIGQLPAGESFGENSHGGRRECSVMSHVEPDSGEDTKLLAIDGTIFLRSVNPVFGHIQESLMGRANHLRKLFAFEEWSDVDIKFLAHWMEEEHLPCGEVLYEAGSTADAVFFMRGGTVALQTMVAGSSEPLVVETISSPCFFGDSELVQGHMLRQHTAVVVDTGRHEEASYTAIPARAFRQLALSDAAEAAYGTRSKLEKLTAARLAWHAMRLEDAADTGELSFQLLGDIQARFIGCYLCGQTNHTIMECPENADGEAYHPPADDDARSVTSESGSEGGTSSPLGSGGASVGSRTGVSGLAKRKPDPSADAEVGRLALLAGTSAGRGLNLPGSSSPGRSRSSISGSPRSLGPGTPRSTGSWAAAAAPSTPRRVEVAEAEGEDWFAKEEEDEAAKRIEASMAPEMRVGLQNARADMRMVLKAVWGFKRLVKVRRAERAAYALAKEEGDDEEKAKLKAKLAGRLAGFGAEAELERFIKKKVAKPEADDSSEYTGTDVDSVASGPETSDKPPEVRLAEKKEKKARRRERKRNQLAGTLTRQDSESKKGRVLARAERRPRKEPSFRRPKGRHSIGGTAPDALSPAASGGAGAGAGGVKRLALEPTPEHAEKVPTPRRHSHAVRPLATRADSMTSKARGSLQRTSTSDAALGSAFPSIEKTSPTNARRHGSARALSPIRSRSTPKKTGDVLVGPVAGDRRISPTALQPLKERR